MESKAQFRKQLLALRNQIPEALRKEKDGLIAAKVLSSEAYAQAGALFIYLNMGTEVATRSIIKTALADSKRVALPVAIKGTREMHFIEITDLDHLVKSSYGALEPVFQREKIIASDEHTLIIVPGCGFDKMGYRMGYGGGYYDTYLSAYSSYKNMAVAYREQMVPAVPREAHDQPLDGLFTEEEVYYW